MLWGGSPTVPDAPYVLPRDTSNTAIDAVFQQRNMFYREFLSDGRIQTSTTQRPTKENPLLKEGRLKPWERYQDIMSRHPLNERRYKLIPTVKRIGHVEAKPIGSLNILEKKPLGNYFAGTREKKHIKKRSRSHKIKQNLKDFVAECDQSGVEIPEICSESSLPVIIPTKEEIIKKQLERSVHEYMEMKKHNDRKCQRQQKVKEENYIKELEDLAETWMKYFSERKQLSSCDDACQQKPPQRKTRTYRSRYFFRSQEFSSNHKDELPEEEKEKKEEEVNLKRGFEQNQSNFDDLNQILGKMMII